MKSILIKDYRNSVLVGEEFRKNSPIAEQWFKELCDLYHYEAQDNVIEYSKKTHDDGSSRLNVRLEGNDGTFETDVVIWDEK